MQYKVIKLYDVEGWGMFTFYATNNGSFIEIIVIICIITFTLKVIFLLTHLSLYGTDHVIAMYW